MMFLIAQNQGAGGGFDAMTILFIVGIVAVFYLFILRPAKKREQERKEMVDSLKKGANIITIGGIYGKVIAVREKDIIIRIDEEKDVRIKMVRSAVNRILDGEESSSEDTLEDSEKI